MLREKYGDEELSKIIREEDLSIMRAKFDSFMAAKNRFAALKGTVLLNSPPTVSAASESVSSSSSSSSSSSVIKSMSTNSKESSTTVIYSGVKDSQVNQSSSAEVIYHTTINTPTFNTSSTSSNITVPDIEMSSSSTSLYHPYDALVQGRDWPAGVNPAKREQYLSPDDFYKVFKMSLTAFNALDNYKKIRLKKEVRLF